MIKENHVGSRQMPPNFFLHVRALTPANDQYLPTAGMVTQKSSTLNVL